MNGAILALRRAVQARLAGDAELTALLGGPRLFDEPPRAQAGPYIIHGEVDARDWSTGSDAGCEQTFQLVVWAGKAGETATALAIAARVGALLHEAELTLAGHRLVNLRQTTAQTRRDGKTGLSRLTLAFRAVTEAL
jgi:hypothetical protein